MFLLASIPGDIQLGYPATVDVVAQSYYSQNGDDEYYSNENIPTTKRRKPQKASKNEVGGGFFELLKNQRTLGATLLGLGLLLTFMGIMLFFESNLLRIGNFCLLAGIPLLIGPDKVRGFFLKESRMQATIITSIGILLVFWGKPRIGLLIEIFGLLNLFGNMLPVLFALGKKIPIIGDVLSIFEGRENPAPRRYPAANRKPKSNANYPNYQDELF